MQINSFIKKLKQDLKALYLAYKKGIMPWYGQLLTLFLLAYAFSPVDLIPDFIPVIGWLDDLLLLPAGVWICWQLIAPEQKEVLREQASKLKIEKTKFWWMAVLFGLLWALLFYWLFQRYL